MCLFVFVSSGVLCFFVLVFVFVFIFSDVCLCVCVVWSVCVCVCVCVSVCVCAGTPVNRIPIMAKQVLDLYKLFKLVTEKGGLVEVINKKIWREITKGLNLP